MEIVKGKEELLPTVTPSLTGNWHSPRLPSRPAFDSIDLLGGNASTRRARCFNGLLLV